MKCPECDSQQPDNAVTCSKCGLSFEVWREMNPIEASIQGEDMSFPETPEDPAPEKKDPEPTQQTTRFREVPAPKPGEEDKPPKAPQEEKKPFPIALIGGLLGGLAVIGVLVFFLKRPSTPSNAAVATVVPNVPAATSSPTPTSSPVPSPTAVKAAPVVKPPTATPTYSPTPKPKPTATATPTDIPLDEKSTEGGATPAAPASEAPAKDLLESSGSGATPTPIPPVASPPVPSATQAP